MFAKATPLLSQTQNQEQSHCRNRHGSRCEPAQGVGRRACTEGTLTQAPLSGHLLHPEMLKIDQSHGLLGVPPLFINTAAISTNVSSRINFFLARLLLQ